MLTTFLGNGYEYRSIMQKQDYKPEYPDWRTEVELWRSNPSYQMNIWPTPWKMNLDAIPARSPEQILRTIGRIIYC